MFPITAHLIMLLVLAITLYSLHKVRRVHLLLHELRDHARKESSNLFRQLEALHGLYVELGLDKSLPGTRGWAASPDFLVEVARQARAGKPAVVVECSSGTSTLVLARCMQLNGSGKVFSLEHDPVFAAQTRAQLARLGLTDWAKVVDAPLRLHTIEGENWTWYGHEALPGIDKIDLLVIDGPPQQTGRMARYPAGPALFGRLARGAAVFLDDANRPDEDAIVKRWLGENRNLAHEVRDCEKGCAVLRVRS